MRGSFKARVFRNIILLVVVSSCSFALLYAFKQRSILRKDLLRHGTVMSEVLAVNLRLGLMTGSEDFLREAISGMMEHEEVLQAAVYDVNGSLVKTEAKAELGDLVRPYNAVRHMTGDKQPMYVEGPDYLEFWAPVYYFKSPISYGNDFFPEPAGEKVMLGFARLSLSKKDITEGINSILAGTLSVALLFIVIGALTAYVVARKATLPLKRLVNEIRAVGRTGEPRSAVSPEGDVEIAELSTAFNAMTEALRKKELERVKEEAEKRKLEGLFYQAQRNEALGRLAGGIAHDVNNLLGIILSNMELARMKAPETIAGYVDRAIGAVERGKDIVRNLVHFSSGMPADFRPVDLGLITSETLQLLGKFSEDGIKVSVDVMPGLRQVYANPAQLQQVVMNLYLNARDAITNLMERGVQRDFLISFRVENVDVPRKFAGASQARPGEFVKLTVGDNGCGMEEETLARIFEPYFTTKEGSGSGLGLSSVHNIVTQHGGWIDVETEQDSGTVFEAYFPMQKGGPVREGTRQPENYEGGPESILIVDDERHMADAAKEMLEHLGYSVVAAYSGEDAVRIFGERGKSIDLVISDMLMPGMSGAEVLARIRLMSPGVKTLLISGNTGDRLDVKTACKGADDFLAKPYRLHELSAKVRQMLGPVSAGENIKQTLNRIKLSFIKEKTVPHNESLTSSETVYRLFSHISSEPREIIIALYLDSRKRIIGYDNVTQGTVSEAFVYPLEILKTALIANATSLVLVHNHPSGDVNPSVQDIQLTADVISACKNYGVELVDHVIIGDDGYYSFKGNGLL